MYLLLSSQFKRFFPPKISYIWHSFFQNPVKDNIGTIRFSIQLIIVLHVSVLQKLSLLSSKTENATIFCN